MKNKISIIAMIVLTLIMVTGCSSKAKPETVVSEFVEAIKVYDLQLMASKINPEDEAGKKEILGLKSAIEGTEEEKEKTLDAYVKSNASKIEYDIKETKVDGDQATVAVDFKYVNGEPVFTAALGEYMEIAFSELVPKEGLTQEQSDKMLGAIIADKKVEIEESFEERTVNVKVIKIDDAWYIEKLESEMFNIILSNLLEATGN